MPVGFGYYPLADGHFHICTEVTMTIDEWRKNTANVKRMLILIKGLTLMMFGAILAIPKK